ncbi:hypothetical protein HELRODRAFT_170263 [Helobdella robusta]|uniref:EF-hand domain-containing protein n=1 Tax=Helobdella robusta TaxID=6412 RepID=T1F2U7_HELRO|nr:hypothetical protein HELRODRAFT_170263 [Helobdella robusta]ESO07720.1 hypothetical protein HELRODRAFT_170263 [Helobdella robusta]
MLQLPSVSDHLSSKNIEELKEVFQLFDTDKDGSITSRELKTVLNALRIDTTDQETKDMISSIDLDGDGTVDFDEFLRMMSGAYSGKSEDQSNLEKAEQEELRHAFQVFDIDGNGYIDARELKITMSKLGENLSDREVKRMMKMADRNNDGKIDYEGIISL